MSRPGISQLTVVGLVILVLLATSLMIYLVQYQVEQEVLVVDASNLDEATRQRELEKLIAEIRRIRSETIGGLFWVKLIGVFVVVGGAVGGYLLAQSHATRTRLEFEHRKDVDAAYQTIVRALRPHISAVASRRRREARRTA